MLSQDEPRSDQEAKKSEKSAKNLIKPLFFLIFWSMEDGRSPGAVLAPAAHSTENS